MAQKKTQHIDLGITRVDMGREVRAELTVETDKGYRGGIESDARVSWVGNGFRTHAFGLGAGGDFTKKFLLTPGICTQKKIDTQHAQVFTPEVLDALTAEAKDYYANNRDKRNAA